MGRIVPALALALLAPSLQAAVQITAADGRIDVSAAQAPVSDVLDGLARKTRMKVVYDGGTPRNPVTVQLRGRTPAEAVLGVLEGLGLNYALVLDLSGTEVETLMIVGTGGGSSSMGAAGVMRPARNHREIVPDAEDDGIEGEQPMAYEAPAPEPPKNEDPRPAAPGPVNPINPFPAGAPMLPGPPLIAPSPAPNPPPNH